MPTWHWTIGRISSLRNKLRHLDVDLQGFVVLDRPHSHHPLPRPKHQHPFSKALGLLLILHCGPWPIVHGIHDGPLSMSGGSTTFRQCMSCIFSPHPMLDLPRSGRDTMSGQRIIIARYDSSTQCRRAPAFPVSLYGLPRGTTISRMLV